MSLLLKVAVGGNSCHCCCCYCEWWSHGFESSRCRLVSVVFAFVTEWMSGWFPPCRTSTLMMMTMYIAVIVFYGTVCDIFAKKFCKKNKHRWFVYSNDCFFDCAVLLLFWLLYVITVLLMFLLLLFHSLLNHTVADIRCSSLAHWPS